MWESVADPNIYRAVNVLNGVKTNPWLGKRQQEIETIMQKKIEQSTDP